MEHLFVYADFDFLTSPTLIGQLSYDCVRGNEVYLFQYDSQWLSQYRYLSLSDDINNHEGIQYAENGIFGCFADALPDRWGRNLIDYRERIEAKRNGISPRKITSFDYLKLLDDRTRMGAFRFKSKKNDTFINESQQLSVPPITSIRELTIAAQNIEKSIDKGTLPEEKWILQLFNPGTSLGGARPKANVVDEYNNIYIAKFPSFNDQYDIGAWEHFCHIMALKAGISAATTSLFSSDAKHHTLLSLRFDRTVNGRRKHFASALTMLGLKDGDGAKTGKGYLDIVDFIIRGCIDSKKNLYELYRRIAFNICVGNADDHFRNHGFLLTEKGWTLSPAYDINPTLSKTQALLISDNSNEADIRLLYENHDAYMINEVDAKRIITEVTSAIRCWRSIAKKLHLKDSEVALFKNRLDNIVF